MQPSSRRDHGSAHSVVRMTARGLWYVPGRFSVARVCGFRYTLRCVLFHNVSEVETPFTDGLKGTINPSDFEAALAFITAHYTPVSLDDVLAGCEGEKFARPPLLVTFDDAYACVAEVAAPVCSKFRVPAVFFVNAACLNNHQLALDNLVCFVANTSGMGLINAAIGSVVRGKTFVVNSLADVFARFLPAISFAERKRFHESLLQLAGVSEPELAAQARLYLTTQQLRELAAFNFEVADHTYSHANCRSLLASDFAEEIDRNKAILEGICGRRVRAFSVPYGSAADLTGELQQHLQGLGYDAMFLAEGRANASPAGLSQFNRISLKGGASPDLFADIEILPRLRSLRDRLRRLNSPSWESRQNRKRRPGPTLWRGTAQTLNAVATTPHPASHLKAAIADRGDGIQ